MQQYTTTTHARACARARTHTHSRRHPPTQRAPCLLEAHARAVHVFGHRRHTLCSQLPLLCRRVPHPPPLLHRLRGPSHSVAGRRERAGRGGNAEEQQQAKQGRNTACCRCAPAAPAWAPAPRYWHYSTGAAALPGAPTAHVGCVHKVLGEVDSQHVREGAGEGKGGAAHGAADVQRRRLAGLACWRAGSLAAWGAGEDMHG